MTVREERHAREALAHVARESVAATLEPLPGGTEARCWRVTYGDGRAYVLRLPVPGSNALLDVATEARAMSAAARAGLAPTVAAHDAERGILLTLYRPGSAWRSADARRPENIRRLCAVLRALHAVPIELPAFAAEAIARRYLLALAVSPPIARDARAAGWGDELLGLARRYDARYEATTFCHNDLVAANVLDDGELALVDFEYAVRGTPLLDLASFAGMNGLDGAERIGLLEAYWGASPTTAELAEFASLVRMVRLMAWFWALLGAANTGGDPSPYAPYLAELALDLQQE